MFCEKKWNSNSNLYLKIMTKKSSSLSSMIENRIHSFVNCVITSSIIIIKCLPHIELIILKGNFFFRFCFFSSRIIIQNGIFFLLKFQLWKLLLLLLFTGILPDNSILTINIFKKVFFLNKIKETFCCCCYWSHVCSLMT